MIRNDSTYPESCINRLAIESGTTLSASPYHTPHTPIHTQGKPTNHPILQILLQLLFNFFLLPNRNLRNNLNPRSALRAHLFEQRQTSGDVFCAGKILEEDAYCAGVFDCLGGALAAEGEHLHTLIKEKKKGNGEGGVQREQHPRREGLYGRFWF